MKPLDRILLRLVCGLVGLLSVSFVSWATWTTAAIFQLESDYRTLKVANHLALEKPILKASPKGEPMLALPSLGADLFMKLPPPRR